MKKHYLSLLFFYSTVIFAQIPGSESAILTVDATIPYQGYGEASPLIGSAQYKIYYDNVDGVLDKPVFLIDGFDPNGIRDFPALYDMLNYGTSENLADRLRDEGYDLVILNFEASYASPTNGTILMGGADFIQRNAFTLVELINVINDLKDGDEPNVMIGPSMGGLISRYALRYMEQNLMDHDTRLYLSFDAPHRGANIPIGLQYVFNYMVNGEPQIAEAAPIINGLLNSPAAKQMLIDHYLGHVNASGVQQDNLVHTPKGAPNFRDVFQTEMDAMGFPRDTRNVAITNGSGVGQMTGTPGMELINHTFNTGVINLGGFPVNTRAKIQVHFAPVAAQTIEVANFVGQAWIFTWLDVFNFSATSTSPDESDGLDSAPGGQFDLLSFTDVSNPLITELFDNVNLQYFNFIPTLSGLAIDNTTDWYAPPVVADSPFVNTYIPTDNEPHVTLTQENVTFALAEILQGTLGINEFDQNNKITLQQNPVRDTFTLLTAKDISNANIAIIDLMGKQIFTLNTTLSQSTTIPFHLHTGLYVLQVHTDQGYVWNTKLVVK